MTGRYCRGLVSDGVCAAGDDADVVSTEGDDAVGACAENN